MQSLVRPSTPQASRLASSSSTPVSQNGSNGQTKEQAPTTPKQTPSRSSPGPWQHPQIGEINRRIATSSFTDQNIRRLLYNALGEVMVLVSYRLSSAYLPNSLSTHTTFLNRAHFLAAVLLLYNILLAISPLLLDTDQMVDIPLTPAQRKLLGLNPTATPPTPGSTYSTPTRYRVTSTPLSRSPLSRESTKDAVSGSPGVGGGGNGNGHAEYPSGRNSPAGGNASPLLQKAVWGERERSGSGSGNGSPRDSIFPNSSNSPSPSPLNRLGGGGNTTGRISSSVGLSQKWIYERRRSSSGRLFS